MSDEPQHVPRDWREALQEGQDVMLWQLSSSEASDEKRAKGRWCKVVEWHQEGEPADYARFARLDTESAKAVVRHISVQPGSPTPWVHLEDSNKKVHALLRSSPDLQLAMKDRGMSYSQLQRFAEECRAAIASRAVCDPREYLDDVGTPNPDHGKLLDFEKAPTWLIVELFVKPKTKERGVPFVDVMAEMWPDLGGPKTATHFISHSWKQAFNEQVVTVPLLDDDAIVWICSFAMTQHEERLELLDDSEVFAEALIAPSTRAQVLVLDPDLQALSRMWVLFEVLRGQQHGKHLEIVPHDLLSKTRLMTCAIELERARCTNPDDQQYIRTQLEATGLAVVNERVRGAVLHAMVQLVKEMEETHGPQSLLAAESHYNLGLLYREHGRYEEAIAEIDAAKEVKVSILGEEHPDIVELLNARGIVLRRLGKLSDAEETHTRVIRNVTLMLTRMKPDGSDESPESPVGLTPSPWSLERSIGPNGWPPPLARDSGDLSLAASPMNNSIGQALSGWTGGTLLLSRAHTGMGNTLRRRGRLSEAEEEHRAALLLRRESLGPSHPDVAESHMHLGLVLWEQGRLLDAESELREALQVQIEHLGPEHPDVARTHNRRGLVLQDLGHVAAAEAELKKALAIRIEQLGHSHPDVATTHNNLGILMDRQGKLSEAEVEAREALEIRIAQLGPGHHDVARCHNCLGTILRHQGRLREAETHHRQALVIQETELGPDHLSVANSTSNLGLLLRRKGELVEAVAFLRRALQIFVETLGPMNISTAKCRAHLALVLQDSGQFTEAKTELEMALEVQVSQLGESHLEVARSRSRLGLVLLGEGQLTAAEASLRQALAQRREQLGDNHRDVATTRTILGAALRQQGRLAEALQELTAGLQIRRSQLGHQHMDVAQTHMDVGLVYEELAQFDQAVAEYKSALEINIEALGDGHAAVAVCQSCLSRAETARAVLAPFKACDKDGSGTIAGHLLVTLLIRLEPSWTASQVQELLQVCGLSVVGKVSYSHFIHQIFKTSTSFEASAFNLV